MNQDLYQKTEQFIKDSFVKINKESSLKHFERAVHWLKELKPEADEVLLVAAIAHDVERAYRKQDVIDTLKEEGFLSEKFNKLHAERGAEIIADFLKENNAPQDFIDRVRILISKHEEGGNDDQNLLKDADSISFFENNIPQFLARIEERGKEEIKGKFDWMFNRITYKRAKEIARLWYDNAIKNLN